MMVTPETKLVGLGLVEYCMLGRANCHKGTTVLSVWNLRALVVTRPFAVRGFRNRQDRPAVV